jgi:uncharacterized protein (TIGR02611 family)
MSAEPNRAQQWADKLAERKARYQERGKLYRIGWVTLGVIITLAGCAMLITPGPAFVVIPLGLAMLALEFAWAERALEKALEQAAKAEEKARNADSRAKVAAAIAVVLVIAAAVAGYLYWR